MPENKVNKYFQYIDNNRIYQGINPGIHTTLIYNDKVITTGGIIVMDK